MTCVTAARASRLILGQRFPKPAQARLGVAGTESPVFSACGGLLASGGGPAGGWCQAVGRLLAERGCSGRCKQVLWAGLCPGRKEGWGILEEEEEECFGALIGYKSRGVALGLEGDVEAGPKSAPSERKLW